MRTALELRQRATARWRPDTLANLARWYDASQITGLSDGASVATWKDLSGNGQDATQATGSKQPLYKTGIVNGGPVIRFDGVDDVLVPGAIVTATQVSVFAVLRKLVVGSSYWTLLRLNQVQLLLRQATAGDQWGAWEQVEVTSGVTLGTTAGAISCIQRAANDVDFVTNGSLVHKTNGTGVPGAFNDASIGATGLGQGSPAQFCNVDLAELIIYTDNKSTTDRQSVEAYLKSKWGTP